MLIDEEGTFYVDYTLMTSCGKMPCVAGPFEKSAKARDFVVLLKERYQHGEVLKVSPPRRIPE